jgi:hypothetical protein
MQLSKERAAILAAPLSSHALLGSEPVPGLVQRIAERIGCGHVGWSAGAPFIQVSRGAPFVSVAGQGWSVLNQ